VHVIVVGCGRVGRELAGALQATGHEVVVIDKNATAFDGLPPTFNGRTVVGSGFDREDLEEAGIRDAGAVAAVTSGDNTNIVSARIARETFGIENVVARIYDPRRAVIYQRLGIPTVATVSWTTEQVMRRLDPSRVAREWTDATGSVVLLERQLPDAWVGRRLGPIDELPGARLAAVSRNGVTSVGSPELVGQAGDLLYVAVESSALDALDSMLATGKAEAHAR
jgi:trk system potassium uptake protein TrkA